MSQRGLLEGWEERLVTILTQPNVERILLFGSRARGEADAFSDLDLIMVRRTSSRFLERLGEAYQRLAEAALRLGVDVDVLVYTPAEYRRLLAEGNPLVTQAHWEGRVLYEKSATGGGALVSPGCL